MALEDLFMGLDIQEFLFYQVLRIDPGSNLVTGDIGRDLLFVLVIPSLVGIMVLRSISTVVLNEHGYLKSLFSVAALGTIVYLGMYTFIAQFSIFIFFMWIFLYGGIWGYKAIVGRGGHAMLSGASNKVGKLIGDKITKAAAGKVFTTTSATAAELSANIHQAVAHLGTILQLEGAINARGVSPATRTQNDLERAEITRLQSEISTSTRFVNEARRKLNFDPDVQEFIVDEFLIAAGGLIGIVPPAVVGVIGTKMAIAPPACFRIAGSTLRILALQTAFGIRN